MHFRAEHEFDASPAAVAALLVDPAFYETLELPDVGPAQLISHVAPQSGSAPDAPLDGEGSIVVRYEYTGNLDSLVRRLLGGARLTWTQELHLRRAPDDAGSGTAPYAGSLAIHADANPALLHGQAVVRLDGRADGTTTRVVDGEVVVALPGFGGMAERRIVPGILARLDVEAAALGHRLR